MFDFIFTVKNFRFPMLLFFISIFILFSSFYYFPFQSKIINLNNKNNNFNLKNKQQQNKEENYFNSKYLIEYYNWMILLNNTLPNKFEKIIKSNLNSNINSNNKINYQINKPFPHFVIDEIFPESILNEVIKEFSDKPIFQNNLKNCVKGGKCYSDKYQKGKSELSKPESYGPATAALFSFLKTQTVLTFLEKLTNIQSLIADDQHLGSGLHQTLPGGFLGIHSDFNRHKITNLHRRVNLFIFLNPSWEDSYGGHLELWPTDLTTCVQRISPILGRFAVFSSTDFSYHGHPTPLTCPPDRSRRSLALYYYTETRPSSECINNNCDVDRRTTNFVKPLCVCGEKGCGEELKNSKVLRFQDL